MQPSLAIGDAAPHFAARSPSNPTYHIDTAAGHYLILSFFERPDAPYAKSLFQALAGPLRSLLDDEKFSFFGINADPAGEAKLKNSTPGIRFLFDDNYRISTLYGIGNAQDYAPSTIILDPMLRVIATLKLDAPDHAAQLDALMRRLPAVSDHASVPMHAPVLIVPRVFSPEFCRELIGIYNKEGGQESGFMRQKDEKTVGVLDPSFKRRKDFNFEKQPEYEALRSTIRRSIVTRLLPQIQKAFHYDVRRIERYVVACYEDTDQGFFRRHRDNTTKATEHRRFACTINLNAEEFEGGNLLFPEFGAQTYRAPTGGAVIFSCSLLHEATPVTRGTRYAFLPFFYDDSAAKIRAENLHYLQGGFQQAT